MSRFSHVCPVFLVESAARSVVLRAVRAASPVRCPLTPQYHGKPLIFIHVMFAFGLCATFFFADAVHNAVDHHLMLPVRNDASRSLLTVDDRTGIVFEIVEDGDGRHMAPRYVHTHSGSKDLVANKGRKDERYGGVSEFAPEDI